MIKGNRKDKSDGFKVDALKFPSCTLSWPLYLHQLQPLCHPSNTMWQPNPRPHHNGRLLNFKISNPKISLYRNFFFFYCVTVSEPILGDFLFLKPSHVHESTGPKLFLLPPLMIFFFFPVLFPDLGCWWDQLFKWGLQPHKEIHCCIKSFLSLLLSPYHIPHSQPKITVLDTLNWIWILPVLNSHSLYLLLSHGIYHFLTQTIVMCLLVLFLFEVF